MPETRDRFPFWNLRLHGLTDTERDEIKSGLAFLALRSEAFRKVHLAALEADQRRNKALSIFAASEAALLDWQTNTEEGRQAVKEWEEALAAHEAAKARGEVDHA